MIANTLQYFKSSLIAELALICIPGRGGSRPRPRTQKKSEAKAKVKDSPWEDRPSRGQGQECSRPRTKDAGANVLKKKGLQNFFSGDLEKKGFQKNFLDDLQNFNNSKNIAVLEPRTGQFSRT